MASAFVVSARYAPPVSAPDFKTAARRHHSDAQFLFDDRRWPNADHLAGVAAECGLKAILLHYLGARLDSRSRPVWGQNSRRLDSHIKQLWDEVRLVVAGRSAPVFASLVTGSAPFADWEIDDRYSDGNTITERRALDHLDTARAIMEVLEQAVRDGVLP